MVGDVFNKAMDTSDFDPQDNRNITVYGMPEPREYKRTRIYLDRMDGSASFSAILQRRLTIGRMESADIVLADDRTVSRRHCIIAKIHNEYYIADKYSHNGVYCNGEKIGIGPHNIRTGDIIRIGRWNYTIRIVEETVP